MNVSIIDTVTGDRIASGSLPITVELADGGVALFASVGQIEPEHSPRYQCVESVVVTTAPAYNHLVVSETWQMVNGREEVSRVYARNAATVCSPKQARLALHQLGLLTAVEAAVDAAGAEAKIVWDYATEIRRDDPILVQLATSLGIAEQLPDMFDLAVTL